MGEGSVATVAAQLDRFAAAGHDTLVVRPRARVFAFLEEHVGPG